MQIHELMVKAAWLYHVEGLTQAQIGERMHLTRRRVNELLAAALEEGVVRVSFASTLAENVALEAGLSEAFGLRETLVAPTPSDPSLIHPVIGRVAAGFLDRLLPDLKPRAIGVGWGTTLRETVSRMTRVSAGQDRAVICSMMGGLTRGAEVNTFEIVRSFARTLEAHCRYFAAPIYADSEVSRDLIVAQPFFRGLLEEAAGVDVSFLSVGDVTGESLQVRYGLPPGTDISELVAVGAVGDLLGRYLDSSGRPVDHPLNRQVISPELDQYMKIPNRIIASGGVHKRAVLLAALRTGLATHLVTDADTACWLLDAD